MVNQPIIATGWSNDTDAFKAGKESAKMALGASSAKSSTRWAMAFCGGRHRAEAVLSGIRDELGDIEIVGGSAVGTITNDYHGYTGYECAVTIFSEPLSKPGILAVGNLDQGEFDAGLKLGAKIRKSSSNGDTVLLFYDSVRSGGPPPILNTASSLMDGIYAGVEDRKVNIVGAGLVADFQLSQSYVFDGQKAKKQIAVAIILPALLSTATIKMDGCIPLSSFMEITKVEGPVIYEIDNKPALKVLKELMGDETDSSSGDNISLIMTLGEKHGDLLAPFDESAYVNRLIVSTDPENGSVTMFEADFQKGTQIQVMTRDNSLMLESVKKRTREILTSLGSDRPIWSLYINCAGRSSAFTGSEVEDASVLQAELPKDFPLMGFYSGVELAPLINRTRPLDWTGVLTLFTLKG